MTLRDMINEAKRRHGDNITPIGRKRKWHRCLTKENGNIYFWYNDDKGSSHIIKSSIIKDKGVL